MAHTLLPGIGGSVCTEIDVLEINNNAAQSAIHTETGGQYGSHRCDQNGCAAMLGGLSFTALDQGSARALRASKDIGSNLPFRVQAQVEADGELRVTLFQHGKDALVFDKRLGGNPQGSGVPEDALKATSASMGKLAVASLGRTVISAGLTDPAASAATLIPLHSRFPMYGACPVQSHLLRHCRLFRRV